MEKSEIKGILEEVLPVEYMTIGEDKVDYLLEERIEFDNQNSDTGHNLSFEAYLLLVTMGIQVIKETYAFIKEVRKDLRKTIKPEDVLKKISEKEKLTDQQKKELVKKVLTLVEEEEEEEEKKKK